MRKPKPKIPYQHFPVEPRPHDTPGHQWEFDEFLHPETADKHLCICVHEDTGYITIGTSDDCAMLDAKYLDVFIKTLRKAKKLCLKNAT